MNDPATPQAQQLPAQLSSSAATTNDDDAIMTTTTTPMTTAVAATPMTTGGSGTMRRTSGGSSAEDNRPAAMVVTAKKRSASGADDAAAVMMMTPHLLPNGNSNKKPTPERLVLGQLDDASSNPTTADGAEPEDADDAYDAHKAEPTATTMSTTTVTSHDTTSRAALEAVRIEHEALRKVTKECFQAHQKSCHDLEQLTQRLREALDEADRYRSMEEHNRKTIAVRAQREKYVGGMATNQKAFSRRSLSPLPPLLLFFPQNLIRAKEAAMAQARAALEVTSNDGAHRAELSALAEKYEAAMSNHQESSRKCALLKGELDHAHMQLSKCRSDKAKVDRELRKATHALHHAQSQSGSGSGGNDFAAGGAAAESDQSELDFYKSKSSSLSLQLNRLKAVEAEKDRQLDELRRQVERYQMIGHHKLHDGNASAASASGKGSSRSTNGGGMHKSKTH
jgi:hypothetical protein